MNVIDVMAATLAELLREDARRVLLGEDVRTGGMLGLSRRCIDDPELAARALALPLLPATLAAHAGGLAAAGMRPIVLLPGVAPLLEGLAGLREVGALAAKNAGERTAPVLFVAPCGPGFGTAGDAVDAPETALVHTPGLRVIVLGRAHEAAALLTAAANFEAGEEPTVLLVPRMLLATALDDEPVAELGRLPGEPVRVRAGRAMTVFAWGECVELALAACAAAHGGDGVDAAVWDTGGLAPLSIDTLVEAARDTGRVVIVHAGPRSFGVGAELAAVIADRAVLWLDGPILRVCGEAGPLGPRQELRALPSEADLVAALQTLAIP